MSNPTDRQSELARVAARYAVAITPAMAELMEAGAQAAGIARQFRPDSRELDTRPDEHVDPIGDDAHLAAPGLVHRYRDRVLLKLVSTCAVYCRFCFRRETVGPELGAPLGEDEIARALDYIRARPSIWEVIVSGGDPLIAGPRRIARLTQALGAIPHVKVVRWHTRVPAVAPGLVTDELVAALRSPGRAVWVALHANHPDELTPAARTACARLIDAGIAMVSQTVLLAGVNDEPATLEALLRALVETRIKPYYLHHLDRAPGTAHFRTSIGDGQQLMHALRGRLSGLAQPTYVLDIPGGHGKVPIGPGYIDGPTPEAGGHLYAVRDPSGCVHDYREEADGGRTP